MDNRVLAVLNDPDAITLIQTTVQVAKIARRLRQERIPGTADAVHLASAIALSVDFFMTTDERLPIGKSVMGVSVAFRDSPSGNLVLPV